MKKQKLTKLTNERDMAKDAYKADLSSHYGNSPVPTSPMSTEALRAIIVGICIVGIILAIGLFG